MTLPLSNSPRPSWLPELAVRPARLGRRDGRA
jgi:hypothetical protein